MNDTFLKWYFRAWGAVTVLIVIGLCVAMVMGCAAGLK